MILPVLRTAVTSKIAVGATAIVMVGGGAALAVEDASEAPAELEEPDALPGPEEADEYDDPHDTEGDGEEDTEGDGGTDEVPEVADRTQERVRDITAFCDEQPQASFCRGPSDANGDQRSETARNVHRALTGGSDIVPGDPEFGRTVSERARSGAPGDLGRLVSRAARGLDISDEQLDLGPREQPGNRNGRDNGDGPDAEVDPDASIEPVEPVEPVVPDEEIGPQVEPDRPETGPPPHANANPNARANRDR